MVSGEGEVHVVVGQVGGKVAGLEYLEVLVVSQRDKGGVPLPEGGGIASPGVPRLAALLVVAQHSSPAVFLRLKQVGIQSNQGADQPVEIISNNTIDDRNQMSSWLGLMTLCAN